MPSSRRVIGDDQWAYRRIPLSQWSSPKDTAPPLVAFLPNQNDIDGLSVDLASLTTIERAVISEPSKPYHLCCLSVARLRSAPLNLSVIADPLPTNPAHALIPELSRGIYELNKPAMKLLADFIVKQIIQPSNPMGHFVLIAIPDR